MPTVIWLKMDNHKMQSFHRGRMIWVKQKTHYHEAEQQFLVYTVHSKRSCQKDKNAHYILQCYGIKMSIAIY